MTRVLIKRKEDTETQEECLMTTEAEVGVTHLQTEDHEGLLATTGR